MKQLQTDKNDAKGKQKANLKKKFKPGKKQKGKQKAKPDKDSDESEDERGTVPLKETRISDEPIPKKVSDRGEAFVEVVNSLCG